MPGTSSCSWLRYGSEAILLSVWLVLGCQPPPTVPTSLPPAAVEENISIGSGDVVAIKVVGRDELSGSYEVDEAGEIRFPWIGAVKVGQRQVGEVAREIETRLADGWLRQPEVNVKVETRKTREVSVLGQVKTPNSYEFTTRLTLMKAISLAGGLGPLADGRRVKLIRQTEAGLQTFEIDVRSILDGEANDLPLEPGDIVFIPESKI